MELAHLSKYFSDKQKSKFGKPEEKKGCITYKEKNGQLKPGANIIEGEMINKENSVVFEQLLRGEKNVNVSDNLEVIFLSIELFFRRVYANVMTSELIEEKIKLEKVKMIQMIVYDCLYGNNDRHDENWSFIYNKDNGFPDINLYPLYDNERVLGLYENQNTIEKALTLNERDFDDYTTAMLFSKMRVPGEKKKNSTYKDVLGYLLEKYPETTSSEIAINLWANSKEKVRRMSEECDGLPQCYVDFGSRLYETRYDYAKDILDQYMKKKDGEYKVPTSNGIDYYIISLPNGLTDLVERRLNKIGFQKKNKETAYEEYPTV